MHLRLLLLFFGMSTALGVAQQRPHYSQYMMNNFVLNPAVSGIEDYVDVKTGYRNQWSGFGDEPITYYVSGHWALNKPDATSTGPLPVRGGGQRSPTRSKTYNPVPAHDGLGALFVSDQTGPLTRTTLNLAYAHHFPLNNETKIAFGLSGGVTQNTLNFDLIKLANPADPLAQSGKINGYQPDLNLGAWLYNRKFYVGLSAHQLVNTNFGFKTNLPNNREYGWLDQRNVHLFATAGYRKQLNEVWAFTPSVMVKYLNPTPVSFDVNAKMYYQDRFWFGASYRQGDAVVGVLGFNVSHLINVGYSYDYVLSNIRYASRASHEVVIGIMLNNKQRIVCPVHLW